MALFEEKKKPIDSDDAKAPEKQESGSGDASEVDGAESTLADDLSASMGHYLSTDHLMHHVQDSETFPLPYSLENPVNVPIPNLLGYTNEKPMIEVKDPALKQYIGSSTFAPTKFVVLELIAAILIAAIFIGYANRVKDGQHVKGWFWNLIEVFVLYIRDEVAVPAIGSKDAKQYLPFLWTVFFFVLGLNLLGMIPYMGSATGSISVTLPLALSVFLIVLLAGTQKLGFLGFWKAQAPHMELPFFIAVVIVPMIWVIEVFGLFIKHMVLAVRLFANMFAGHMVLAVFVGFMGVASVSVWTFAGLAPLALGASVGISLLELMVAFIQAYVFTFLAALFIGAAVHPH